MEPMKIQGIALDRSCVIWAQPRACEGERRDFSSSGHEEGDQRWRNRSQRSYFRCHGRSLNQLPNASNVCRSGVVAHPPLPRSAKVTRVNQPRTVSIGGVPCPCQNGRSRKRHGADAGRAVGTGNRNKGELRLFVKNPRKRKLSDHDVVPGRFSRSPRSGTMRG